LRALVGPSRAKIILMAGQKNSAEDALSFGLVDRLEEPEALLETARELAADCMTQRPEIVQGIKALCDG
jgi:enoyl-CoA hydratase/carnithine racemase